MFDFDNEGPEFHFNCRCIISHVQFKPSDIRFWLKEKTWKEKKRIHLMLNGQCPLTKPDQMVKRLRKQAKANDKVTGNRASWKGCHNKPSER